MADVSGTKDWYLTYVRHRDMIERKIKSIEDEGEKVIIRYKDKTLTAIIMPLINGVDALLSQLEGDKHITLVTLNNEKNLKTIIGQWEKVSKYKNFRIIFANPNTHEKWMVCPYTHNRISESPEKGLKSLFETVEEVQKV